MSNPRPTFEELQQEADAAAAEFAAEIERLEKKSWELYGKTLQEIDAKKIADLRRKLQAAPES